MSVSESNSVLANTNESVTVLEDSKVEESGLGVQYKVQREDVVVQSQVSDLKAFKKLLDEVMPKDIISVMPSFLVTSKDLDAVSFPVISKDPAIKCSIATSTDPITVQSKESQTTIKPKEIGVQTLNIDKKVIKRIRSELEVQKSIMKCQKENTKLIEQMELMQFSLNKVSGDSENIQRQLKSQNEQLRKELDLLGAQTQKKKAAMKLMQRLKNIEEHNKENIIAEQHFDANKSNAKDELSKLKKELLETNDERSELKRTNSCKIRLPSRKLESTHPAKVKDAHTGKLKFNLTNDLKNQFNRFILNSKSSCTKYEAYLPIIY
eukprot:TRINITY_DN13027_c0_g3_i1.p1 TRINITY_DN13027_c0_g3~~TRINITY_DN13027_c0_g3_i1.p1  ORF type:complete len:360 (-),score=99.52 TRINITY_DN13027_c0_g3_i1:243-1208(-)